MYLCDSASIELYEFPINFHNFPFQNYEAQSAGSGAEVSVGSRARSSRPSQTMGKSTRTICRVKQCKTTFVYGFAT